MFYENNSDVGYWNIVVLGTNTITFYDYYKSTRDNVLVPQVSLGWIRVLGIWVISLVTVFLPTIETIIIELW